MPTALIFDLDGLLTDTETLHCRAYQQTLAAVGYTLTELEFADHWVRDGLAIADLVRLRNLPHDPKTLHRHKVTLYQSLLQTDLRPMPGALDLLARLHGQKKLALATASAKESALPVLHRLNIARYFQVILTADDVTRRKPHPDLFLKAAQLLHVPPAECLVLEDAEKGILAAHAAGMSSIAVPTPHTRTHNFSRATHLAPNLSAIPNHWLGL